MKHLEEAGYALEEVKDLFKKWQMVRYTNSKINIHRCVYNTNKKTTI